MIRLVYLIYSYGYSVQYQKYNIDNKIVKNICAIKLSATENAESLIVGAHYELAQILGQMIMPAGLQELWL